MRTAKCVVLFLVVALTLLGATAPMPGKQANADKTPPATQPSLSGTTWASCVVTVTVDSAMMPLGGTIEALVLSSDVAGKAAQNVLGISDVGVIEVQNLLQVQLLSQDSPAAGEHLKQPSAAPHARNSVPGNDEDMIRQMAQIYGDAYARLQANAGTDTSGPSGDQASVQRASLKLTVTLGPSNKPAAREFLQAVVENLRATLLDAHAQRVSELNALLRDVESRRHALETGAPEGAAPDPAEKRVKEQLDTIVDLAVLQPMMPVAEAMETLRKSVDPPLQIVVLWRDLEQNTEIMASSPIEIEGPSNVRLGVALELLLKALSAGRPQLLSYQIKGNVITIATAQTLGGPAQPAAGPVVEGDVAALAAEKTDLTRKIQSLYVDLATQEAREKAISRQIAVITEEAAKRTGQDEIARELENLVQISTMNLVEIKKAVDTGRATPAEMWQAQESLTRAKIEFARRREELSKSAGGGQLDAFNKELSQMAVERAGKEAERGVLDQRLADVQRELARVPVYDPAATTRMRIIREALDIMECRMAELQTRIANLQPPMVTMIGAN